jgi:hypothetical protein
MGVPVAVNHALASGIPTVMTSTLSRFADVLAQALERYGVLTLFSDKIIGRMVAIRQPTTEFIGSAIV